MPDLFTSFVAIQPTVSPVKSPGPKIVGTQPSTVQSHFSSLRIKGVQTK